MNEIIYNWNFSNDKKRGNMWYVITLSIVIGLVVWWFLTQQYVMSFVIILITWVTFFIENNSEENTNVFITHLWIKINSTFYDFSKINGYTIIYDGENPILLRLLLIKKWIKYLDLEINNDQTFALKEILPNFISEDEKWELDFSDKLIRLLKL